MVEEVKKEGYGKRPLWQWILLYLVLGIIVYGLIYYFALAKKSGYSTVIPTQNVTPTSAQTGVTSGNIYLVKTDAKKGTYLTDFQGMTLYTFDKDTIGVSNCYNGCAKAWPPYSSGATAQSQFPANITVITRTDGSKQFAWKGMPLYYYAIDAKAGDINGDGVNNVWHIVKPQ
ncbi:MAG TPA: hypothetical protein VF810_01165 [Patescibacteria group bacterium]